MADVLLVEDKIDSEAEDTECSNEETESDVTIEMTQKEEKTDSDNFSGGDLGISPDDLLPPVVKMEKYATSDIVFNRQMVARNLLETLRLVHGNSDEVSRVVAILCNLAEDYEPSVRAELMQQVPHIAAFFNEYDYQLGHLIQQYIVPMIIKYLTDTSNQVRKTIQTSLLLMVEQSLIDSDSLEGKICPHILQLTESSYMDELRTEAVTLLSKLSPIVGKAITEHLFLRRFVALCLDSSFHIRKVCADNFGEMCTIVEQDLTEELLLPKFYYLCEDSVWGVRKICAEVFMPVSCVSSMETRRKILAPVYLNLLCDQSRWVRMAAFQTLGPFISTFAEPSRTGLYYNGGTLTVVNIPESDSSNSPISSESTTTDDPNELSSNLSSGDASDCTLPSCDSNTVQGTRCEVGNYCTVIELNSSSCNSNTNGCHDSKYANCDSSDITTDAAPGSSSLDGITDKVAVVEGECKNLDCSTEDNVEQQWNGDISNHVMSSHDQFRPWFVQKSNSSFSNVIESVPNMVNGFPETLVVGDSEVFFPSLSISETKISSQQQDEEKVDDDERADSKHDNTSQLNDNETNSVSPDIPTNDEPASVESAFNNFQYWRMPLPSVDLDVIAEEIQPSKSADSNGCSRTCQNNRRACLISHLYASSTGVHSDDQANSQSSNLPPFNDAVRRNPSSTCNLCGSAYEEKGKQNSSEMSTTFAMGRSQHQVPPSFLKVNCGDICTPLTKDYLPDFGSNLGDEPPPSLQSITSARRQDIVPPELLVRYLSMTDAARAQSVDSEIARHCAYSLPAVALTLGRRFWPCLKQTYSTLATDMQWKVRRTLASSMHQLAAILGPKIASSDLMPVFSAFIKDLDEVRIGILQHLAEFVEVLEMEDRKVYLPRFPEFLNTDNIRNWRFRHILAEQLLHIAELYEPGDIREFLVPLTMLLIRDKISEVRRVAVRVMAVIVREMRPDPEPAKEVLNEFAELYVHSPKWMQRQIYVYFCQDLVEENSLHADEFAEEVLPHMMYLCWDRVPNVRLAIARCLALVMWPSSAYSGPESPNRELLLQAIHPLQTDLDSDVRFYANMVSTEDCLSMQHSVLSDLDDQAV